MKLKLGMKVKRWSEGHIYEVTARYSKYLTTGEQVKINQSQHQENEYRITRVDEHHHLHRYVKLSDIYSIVQSESYTIYCWNDISGKIIQALHENYGIGHGLTRLPHLDETIEDLQETVLHKEMK